MGVTLILYVIVCWGSDMDLIKELGGYEKAKSQLNDFNESFGYWQNLNQELLEYRREHNIFETNDYVVKKSGKHWSQVFKVHNSNEKITTIQAHVLVMFETRFLRHATDAEIAAGHRL